MKTSVYSWRLEPARKAELEEIARKQERAIADVLDEAVAEWLKRQGANDGDEAVQEQLRRAALATFGRIRGGNPNRAEQSRKRVREKLLRRRGASR
jgi:predicted transcriptional regulator